MNHKDDCTCPICQIPRLEKTIAEQTEQIAMLEKAVDTGVEAEEKLEAENKRLKKQVELHKQTLIQKIGLQNAMIINSTIDNLSCGKAAPPQKGQDNEQV